MEIHFSRSTSISSHCTTVLGAAFVACASLVAITILAEQGRAAPALQRHTPRTTATVTAPKWHLFSPSNSGFSVLMPGVTEETHAYLHTGSLVHIFTCVSPVAGYSVHYFDLPLSRLRSTTPRIILEDAIGGTIREKNTTLLREREITQNDYPGREIILSKQGVLGEERHAIRMFLVKGRYFMILTTRYPSGTDPFRNRAEVFINSFRLVPEDIPVPNTTESSSRNIALITSGQQLVKGN